MVWASACFGDFFRPFGDFSRPFGDFPRPFGDFPRALVSQFFYRPTKTVYTVVFSIWVNHGSLLWVFWLYNPCLLKLWFAGLASCIGHGCRGKWHRHFFISVGVLFFCVGIFFSYTFPSAEIFNFGDFPRPEKHRQKFLLKEGLGIFLVLQAWFGTSKPPSLSDLGQRFGYSSQRCGVLRRVTRALLVAEARCAEATQANRKLSGHLEVEPPTTTNKSSELQFETVDKSIFTSLERWKLETLESLRRSLWRNLNLRKLRMQLTRGAPWWSLMAVQHMLLGARSTNSNITLAITASKFGFAMSTEAGLLCWRYTRAKLTVAGTLPRSLCLPTCWDSQAKTKIWCCGCGAGNFAMKVAVMICWKQRVKNSATCEACTKWSDVEM